ncbi:MAG: HAD family hydrolase [Comamonas sp.]
MNPLHDVRAAFFDWGGTLMSEDGPHDVAMGLWPEVAILPGAKEALQMLHGRLPLVIATNATVSTRPLIELALSRVGLLQYFSHVFCYTDLRSRKSQAEFWQAAAASLGIRPQDIAMVGDSYEQDAAMPRLYGVQGVWFNPLAIPAGALGSVPEVERLEQFSAWICDVLSSI